MATLTLIILFHIFHSFFFIFYGFGETKVNFQPSFTVLYLFSVHLPPPSPSTHTPAAWLRVSLPGLLWIFWGSSSGVLHLGTRWSVYPPYNRVGIRKGKRTN